MTARWSCAAAHGLALPAASAVFPAQERRGEANDDPVGYLPDQCERDNGGNDLRRLAELLAIDQQETKAFRCAHETSFAQLAAERLGVPFDRVRIKENDSSDLPKGLASVGSRSMIMIAAFGAAFEPVACEGRRGAGCPPDGHS